VSVIQTYNYSTKQDKTPWTAGFHHNKLNLDGWITHHRPSHCLLL